MKRALITGVLGQDGSYMAELLAANGYEVHGVTRISPATEKIEWIQKLIPNLKLHRCDILNKKSMSDLIQAIHPSETYNFAGVSDVFTAWANLDYTMAVNAGVPQNILSTIAGFDTKIKFFQASSCLTFGRDGSGLQNETTPANPIHPYGIAKNTADNLVKEYRTVFGLFACSGIFFTHESERRGAEFFSKKVISHVARIKNGIREKLKVGNLAAFRDYGYAPDFVDAAYRMMQQERPTDYVIGTGRLITMEQFVDKCFKQAGLDYKDHIEADPALVRANDTKVLKADIRKITTELGWIPKHNIDQMIEEMGNAELEKLKMA